MSTFFVFIYFTEVQWLFQRKLIFQGSRVGFNIFQGRDLEGGPTFSRWWGGGGGGVVGRVQLAIPIEILSLFIPLHLNTLGDIRKVFGNTKF